jgi:hypothetical protein
VKLCVGAIKLSLNVWVGSGDAEDFSKEAGEIFIPYRTASIDADGDPELLAIERILVKAFADKAWFEGGEIHLCANKVAPENGAPIESA